MTRDLPRRQVVLAALSTAAAVAAGDSSAAYQLGVDSLRLPREQILFVPFAGWDAAGAKTFGYPTFWINRLHAALEEWGAAPDGIGRDVADLLRFLKVAHP